MMRAARRFYLDRENAESDWLEHLKLVEVGKAESIERDEEGNVVWDYGDHIGGLIDESNENLRNVTEAFLLALHHYWEKEFRRLMHSAKYVQSEVIKWLTENGLSPNEDALNQLRLAANCIKHDDGSLAKKRPDLFDQSELEPGMKMGWHDALRLEPQHLKAFFAAVRQSGPQRTSLFTKKTAQ